MSAERTIVSLCKTQASLLVQNLDVACCAIYVMERCLAGSGDRLIPIAIEPEQVVRPSDADAPAKSPARRDSHEGLRAATIEISSAPPPRAMSVAAEHQATTVRPVRRDLAPALQAQQQRDTFALTLDGKIVGVLALYRRAIDWNEEERTAIEAVVATVEYAIALHGQNLALRDSLETAYLNDLQRQSHLSDLFHQVRNPLAALHVFGKLLDRRLAGNSPVLEVVANIIRESDRLKSLLDDLSVVARQPSLELSGLEGSLDNLDGLGDGFGDALETIANPVESTGSTAPAKPRPLLPASVSQPFTEIAVGDLLAPIVSVADAVAESRSLAFAAHIDCPQLVLRTDVKLMTEALNNLVDNALKYTPDGGRVTIGASERLQAGDRVVAISIRDTGLGIPPEDLERVFQRGYRGEKRDTEIQGTGLGLQIVKQIVEQLGAEIEIDSAGRGQGVEVCLRLPVDRDVRQSRSR